MSSIFRTFLKQGRSWLLGGLVSLACLSGAAGAEPEIVETATGATLTRAALLQRLAGVDYVLLGELHDNRLHHEVRGLLIQDLAALRPGLVVVAEHLERGRRVVGAGDITARLQAAGFELKGWRWPDHESLFRPLLQLQLTLAGGNISRAEARRIVREGRAALRPELAVLMEGTPLQQEARQALEQSLLEGHCGQMPEHLKAPMVLAQEARDAAMSLTLQEWAEQGPVVLVAGNGHVRRDYGVPRFLPAARVLSIGFLEQGEAVAAPQVYDYVWRTASMPREDPCQHFSLPASSSRPQ